MNKLLLLLNASMLLFVAWMTNLLDHWLGIVAFEGQFLLFSIVAAVIFGLIWYSIAKKHALAFAIVAFLLFSINFALPAPSERVLRSAQLKLQPGVAAQRIESTIAEAYQDTPYGMPRISWTDSRVLISLSSQEAGNCTAILLQVKNGVIERSEFSAD